MAKIRKYTMVWTLPNDPDVVSVRVRCSTNPFTGGQEDYDIPFDDVGKVDRCDLPLPKTPLIDGDLSVGISTVDDVGNESDISFVTIPFDLVAPAPVTGLLLL